MVTAKFSGTVREVLVKHLEPCVSSIDNDAVYPEEVLKQLGKSGLFGSLADDLLANWNQTLGLIEETAGMCGSTGFAVWCHTASIVYVRNGSSTYLKEKILPKLVQGQILGATGLSNPMKYYAGMESIRLHAQRVSNGYRVSGFLPYVSNLGPNHWFGIIAQIDDKNRMMAFVPCQAEGLRITERKDFLGLNGSATYNCYFQNVFIPDDLILAENADSFIHLILPEIVLNQAGLGFGLTRAIADSIAGLRDKQYGVNQYLSVQPEGIVKRLNKLRAEAFQLIESEGIPHSILKDVLQVRLDASYLALDAAQAGMLHYGGAAYVQKSNASRRLREAYFVAVVTPAIKHLEKMLHDDLVKSVL